MMEDNPKTSDVKTLDTQISWLEKQKRNKLRREQEKQDSVQYTKARYKLPYIVRAGDLPAIIRTDLFTAMLIALTWGMLKPMIAQQTGQLLSSTTIGVYLMIALISVELLPWAMRRSNLKTSTAWIIGYDVFFVIATVIGYFVMTPLQFIYMMSATTIPFIVLGINSSNKLKVAMSKRYPTKLAEKVLTAIVISKNRASLVAIGLTTLLVFNEVSTTAQIVLFGFVGAVQLYYTITSFLKNYK